MRKGTPRRPKTGCNFQRFLLSAFVVALVQWCLIVHWHLEPIISTSFSESSRALSHFLTSLDLQRDQRRRIELPSHAVAPISWVVFYHIYIPAHSPDRAAKALGIVKEQLDQIRSSYAAHQQQSNNTLVIYTTVGQRILPEDMKSLCQPDLRCVNMQSLGSGFEDKTLRKVHAYCSERPDVTVTYLHNKGSHHNRNGANDLWRRHMTLAVTSQECYDAVFRQTPAADPQSCNVCGLLFQTIPSLHFPGNFWTARCDYVKQLLPVASFAKRLDVALDAMENYTDQNILTRQLYDSSADWTTGRGRYGDEQWIASHPGVRPCDVSETPDLRFWKTATRTNKDFAWHLVPRRSLLDKNWQIQPRPNQDILKNRQKRMTDYHLLPGLLVRWWKLYKRVPPAESWVWHHFPDGSYWRERVNALLARNKTQTEWDFVNELVSLPPRKGKKPDLDLSESPRYNTTPWTVFYHIFLPSERNVSSIIEEQLASLQDSFAAQSIKNSLELRYTIVGGEDATDDSEGNIVDKICSRFEKLNCVLHDREVEGNEDLTLTALHEFCMENPSQSVIYFHSKGSYHDSSENGSWRRHLLAATTGRDCLENLNTVESNSTTQCDVCGLQFYPMWAFFFPGNFFVARCSYVRRLLPPRDFALQLNETVSKMLALKKQNLFKTDLYSPQKEGNLGLGRYSWEQWVGSHPSIQPCDLSYTANFRHWVQPQSQSDLKWSMAPRHDIMAPWYRIQTGKREGILNTPSRSMREYFLLPGLLYKSIQLYNETPPLDSWVYEWFPDGDIWKQGVQKYGTNVVRVLTQAYRDGINITELV